MNKLKEIDVDILSVEQIKIEHKDRPQQGNLIRKIIFFLMNEGIKMTFRKIISKRIVYSIYKTLIVVQKDGKKYYNLSIQSHTKSDEFVIQNNFIEKLHSIDINQFEYDQFIQYSKPNYTEHLNALPYKAKPFSTDIKEHYKLGVYLYGLGDYARVYIAPFLKKMNKIYCVDYVASLSTYYAQKFGYNHCSSLAKDSFPSLRNTKKPLAIIATYHSDHSQMAKDIYDQNKDAYIFIEKPPCVNYNDLNLLHSLYISGAKLNIGYNRRHIPINKKIQKEIYNKNKIINFSVKELNLNPSHWYFWDNQGTRITGNLTHWIDLAVYFNASLPTEITLLGNKSIDETLQVSILFEDESLFNISVSDKGNSLRGVQENGEIRWGNESIFIEDYKKVTWVKSNGKKHNKKFLYRKKGHANMYKNLINWYKDKECTLYSHRDFILTTILTIEISEMFKNEIRYKKLDHKIFKRYETGNTKF